MGEHSQLKFYSLGTVAANKPLDSMEIEVVPMEVTPMLDGAITDNTVAVDSKAADAMGGAYQTETPSVASIKATWLPLGSPNRKTAPDVRRGELVAIWQFSDQDKYWWVTLQSDLKLRKLETVIFAISGTKDEAAAATADNTYFFEWSTHSKMIHVHTSKADGEPFAYDIQLNAKEGTFIITDDIGNSISIDSSNHRVTLLNADQTTVDLQERTLKIFAADSISVKTKAYMLDCETMSEKASSSATKETVTNHVTAQTIHTGNIAFEGAGGSVGEATFNASVHSTQDIQAQGVSLLSHQHQENDNHGITDPPLNG